MTRMSCAPQHVPMFHEVLFAASDKHKVRGKVSASLLNEVRNELGQQFIFGLPSETQAPRTSQNSSLQPFGVPPMLTLKGSNDGERWWTAFCSLRASHKTKHIKQLE